MNLYRAELRRIVRRRLTMVFGILAAAGVLVLTVAMWIASSPGPTEADLAAAQAEADALNAEHTDFNDCLEDERYFEENGYDWVESDPVYQDMTHEEQCAAITGAWTAEDVIYTYSFDFAAEGRVMLFGVAIVGGLLMMMLASSAIGAEWSSGSMSNLLVWHPNRLKVWGAKLAAALTLGAVAVVALVILAFGLLYLTSSVRGEPGDLNAAWWGDTLPQLARTVVLTLGMTALGASMAMLGRHTAIAGGVIAGYLIVGEMLVQLISIWLPMAFPERLSLYTWIGAWIIGRTELYDYPENGYASTPEVMVITATEAGLLLGAIVLVFGALATWAFQKRDVA
ncbi:ABC transporter permease [Glycomyces sp. TRM65418]|uniref:ABC transporter permease subunit n=1 Tax=Glycomyces sp. TRM65418 TaxID=2867006 RepID=UPI001CE5CD72|nr:ABC transporter permease subunit [Glycomyces sp. TRM65418]MCC3762022.1 ABC transporter permease [Glycomyces sp. TRM65418]QZD56095.1 ABC transporter permease [Glycomyces sp. TRM65418]